MDNPLGRERWVTARDPSTADLLRIREANLSLRMTRWLDRRQLGEQ
jgi:hypothetical protein